MRNGNALLAFAWLPCAAAFAWTLDYHTVDGKASIAVIFAIAIAVTSTYAVCVYRCTKLDDVPATPRETARAAKAGPGAARMRDTRAGGVGSGPAIPGGEQVNAAFGHHRRSSANPSAAGAATNAAAHAHHHPHQPQPRLSVQQQQQQMYMLQMQQARQHEEMQAHAQAQAHAEAVSVQALAIQQAQALARAQHQQQQLQQQHQLQVEQQRRLQQQLQEQQQWQLAQAQADDDPVNNATAEAALEAQRRDAAAQAVYRGHGVYLSPPPPQQQQQQLASQASFRGLSSQASFRGGAPPSIAAQQQAAFHAAQLQQHQAAAAGYAVRPAHVTAPPGAVSPRTPVPVLAASHAAAVGASSSALSSGHASFRKQSSLPYWTPPAPSPRQ